MFDSFLTTECVYLFKSTLRILKNNDPEIVIANGLPTTGKNQRFGIIL